MIYNRALHPDDYRELQPELMVLKRVESEFQQKRLPYRKDHAHREWEYARILRQLRDLFPHDQPETIKILDTGSGASYFIPILKLAGYDIHVSDSMAYGDITDWLRQQCFGFGITVPLYVAPVENLAGIEDNYYDVTMCISVIEHLAVDQFANGLKELWRVTKPGGYIFITSDYFRNWDHASKSPSLGIQHNLFYPHTSQNMINDVINVEWVGDVDLTYREMDLKDTVNGHSFVNFCLRKPL